MTSATAWTTPAIFGLLATSAVLVAAPRQARTGPLPPRLDSYVTNVVKLPPEFKSTVDRMPSLTEHLPELKRYLLEYPQATPPNTDSFLYHYFWTALELRVLVPDPSRGLSFWFVNVNRSRSDGLSGFVGSLIRGKVRGEAERGMTAALKTIKTALER